MSSRGSAAAEAPGPARCGLPARAGWPSRWGRASRGHPDSAGEQELGNATTLPVQRIAKKPEESDFLVQAGQQGRNRGLFLRRREPKAHAREIVIPNSNADAAAAYLCQMVGPRRCVDDVLEVF